MRLLYQPVFSYIETIQWKLFIILTYVCYLSEISILVKANFNLWHRLIILGSLVFIKYIMFKWERGSLLIYSNDQFKSSLLK